MQIRLQPAQVFEWVAFINHAKKAFIDGELIKLC